MVVESYISLMYSKHTFLWFLILYIPFIHEMYAQVTYMYGIQQLIYQAPYSDTIWKTQNYIYFFIKLI
jgi:hypothetical protein